MDKWMNKFCIVTSYVYASSRSTPPPQYTFEQLE